MFRRFARVVLVLFSLLVFSLGTIRAAHAQLITQHVKGSFGLKAGSQAPSGGYVVAPIFYIYNTDTVRDVNGDKLGQRVGLSADLTSSFFAVGYSQVTRKKILGGNYGFTILFPTGANNRIQGTEIDMDPGAGLTDSVIQPISLGWHWKQADAIAGLIAPF